MKEGPLWQLEQNLKHHEEVARQLRDEAASRIRKAAEHDENAARYRKAIEVLKRSGAEV